MSATVSDVVIVDIIQSVVVSMQLPAGIDELNYEPGMWYQILQELQDLDNSITLKGLKFPLIAMQMPFKEKRGGERPGFCTVRLPRIVIANITKTGLGTEKVLDKYASDGNFKTVLYPLYNEFLKRLARSVNVINNDSNNFTHEKMDVAGIQATNSTNDFIDSIEILDLELQLRQIKTC